MLPKRPANYAQIPEIVTQRAEKSPHIKRGKVLHESMMNFVVGGSIRHLQQKARTRSIAAFANSIPC
jgi:hypothetical protein